MRPARVPSPYHAQFWSPRSAGSGLLPGTCRAGRSGWSGPRGDEPWAGKQSPSRGVRGVPFSARSSPCPQLPRAAGCPHLTVHPALPRTLSPARHHSHTGASAASSLHRHLAAASQAWPVTSSYPSRPDNWISHQSTPESWTRHQQPPPVPGKPARLPWSTEGQARASPASRLARPLPPRPQWLSTSASRLLWDQPSALQDPEELKPYPHPASAWPRSSCKRRWPQQRTGYRVR